MISQEYREVLRQHHREAENWGSSKGAKKYWQTHLEEFISKYGITSILDFGCGKGNNPIGEKYDPGIVEFSVLPDKYYDLVYSMDVLEHIEPEYLDESLEWMVKHSTFGFHSIHTGKANHILPNGKQAHLIVEDKDWWTNKLDHYYEELDVIDIGRKSFVYAGFSREV